MIVWKGFVLKISFKIGNQRVIKQGVFKHSDSNKPQKTTKNTYIFYKIIFAEHTLKIYVTKPTIAQKQSHK